MGNVPLARRNLFADRRRLLASVFGVGLAVMLILLLDGTWAGIQRQTTLYTDNAGADLYVLQPGVRDLTAGASALPLATVTRVRADPDVTWAAPVRTAYVILELHDRKIATYVAGSVPGEHGGAWAITSGRAPADDDEIAVGSLLADRHGIAVGDTLAIAGRRLRVVGLAGTNGFMMSYVFATHDALAAATASASTTSYVLVGTSRPEAVADRLRAEGLNLLDRASVAANNLKLATGIFGSPIRLMVGIGLVAGTLIIALIAYATIVERHRDYGIVKAMGATPRRLAGLAVGQTVTLAALGLVAGVVLFLLGRAAIVALRPQFSVVLVAGALGRAAVAALVMALLAAVVPARRLAALEPAVAFGSAA